MNTVTPATLVAPHGGTLVERIVADEEAASLLARAPQLPRITLDTRELSDLELLATGAASPLRGFNGSRDYDSILDRMRLSDGTVWPLPLTLAVSDEVRASLTVGKEAALYDEAGRLWGTIEVSELFQRDPRDQAIRVWGSDAPTQLWVGYLLSRPPWLVAGDVKVLPLPADLPFANRRLSPRALRAIIEERGWRRVAGFNTRNPIHRAHEYVTKLALEFADGLVIHPVVGEIKSDDVPATVRFQIYETLVARFYPKDRTLLSTYPGAMRFAGPREALFHTLIRKNYGITHFIVGRDHAVAGPPSWGPLEAQKIFDQFSVSEIGVEPLRFDSTFYCRACASFASGHSCPHGKEQRFEISGTKVREILKSGGTLPTEISRPEVAEILRAHYAPDGAAPAATPSAPVEPPTATNTGRGFILWFTGLSGAGKSTLASAIKEVLSAQRYVEVLDGDELRTHINKGLGFSLDDRNTVVQRVGYIARLLARNGVIAITAAISPYAAARNEVRALAARDGIPFIEIFAHAELDALVNRDVKGLYKKALAGELKNFTGVSDPYEPPVNPDVLVRSDKQTPTESLATILDVLRARGLVV
jgi:sulfate adenylyltransferase